LRRDPRIARDCARDAWWLSGRCNHWIPDVLFATVSDRITLTGRHLSAQEMLPEALPAVERHKVILRRGVSGLVVAVDRLEDGHVAGRVVSGSVFVRVGDIPYSFPDLKLPPTAREGLIIGPARPGQKPTIQMISPPGSVLVIAPILTTCSLEIVGAVVDLSVGVAISSHSFQRARVSLANFAFSSPTR
jgi:hypothetical protein